MKPEKPEEKIAREIAVNASRAGQLFDAIEQYAAKWQWGEVEKLLDELYELVGAENSYTGYAYHLGRHPLQEYLASYADPRGQRDRR